MEALWRDMADAPRDGTRVLISSGDDVQFASWDGVHKLWRTTAWVRLEPDGWMPMPAAMGREEGK